MLSNLHRYVEVLDVLERHAGGLPLERLTQFVLGQYGRAPTHTYDVLESCRDIWVTVTGELWVLTERGRGHVLAERGRREVP